MNKKTLIIAGITLVTVIISLLVYTSDLYNSGNSDEKITIDNTDDLIKTFTLEEVQQHNNQESCWMVIESSVYDVTKAIKTHPGGESIVNGCGKDATSFFNNKPNGSGPHSDAAKEFLKTLKIGELR